MVKDKMSFFALEATLESCLVSYQHYGFDNTSA